MPAVRYQGSKYGSLYASASQYHGAKAIVYEIGFQPHKGWGVSGILSGGKASYFGKLYVTADQVVFAPSQEKDQNLTWSLKRTDFTLAQTKDGTEINPTTKDNAGIPNGLIHFQPFENKTGKLEFDKPDEPAFLHKGHLDPPMEAFLNDFNGSINSFDDTYKRLTNELGTE
jgi:hypothetical protein